MSCEFKPSYFFLTTDHWKPWKSFLFRILSFQFRFPAKFRPWKKKNKKALPNVCARRKTVQQLPKLHRARDLSALLSERRLLSAELKKREAPGDGAQLPSHRLYKISLSFILRHRPPVVPSFPLLSSFSTSSSSAQLYWINFAYSSCSSSHLQFPYSKFWIACFFYFFSFSEVYSWGKTWTHGVP